jgi:hypothetical protein
MTQIPNDNDYEAITAPVTFLALRGSLVSHRQVADQLGLVELCQEIDLLLRETEDITRTLLLRTPLPDDEYLDPIFDDEFLTLCRLMGVNLLAWVNQPQILARLRDPDAILARWVTDTSLDASGVDTPRRTTTSYPDQVGEVKESIYVLFKFLRDNHIV